MRLGLASVIETESETETQTLSDSSQLDSTDDFDRVLTDCHAGKATMSAATTRSLGKAGKNTPRKLSKNANFKAATATANSNKDNKSNKNYDNRQQQWQ